MRAAGVAEHEHEVVLAPGADVQADGALPLRAAVAAAEHGLSINTSTLLNLRRAPISYTEWTDETRALFVRLLATGDQLTRTWEELDVVISYTEWTDETRALFVRLLATGDQLTRTWEELDVVGIPSRWMPER